MLCNIMGRSGKGNTLVISPQDDGPLPPRSNTGAILDPKAIGMSMIKAVMDQTVGEEYYWENTDKPGQVHKAILKWVNKIMLEPRLVQLKGDKTHMGMFEVMKRKRALNDGDVFILDTGNMQYIWHGKESNQHEQQAALKVVHSIRESRGPNTHYTILKQGESDDCAAFWKEIADRPTLFGMRNMLSPKDKIMSKEAAGADEEVVPFQKKLKAMSLHNGRVRILRTWYAKKDDSASLQNQFAWRKLESDKAFLLDDGLVLWVWLGKGCGISEATATEQAVKYLQKKTNHVWYKRSHDRPASLPIRIVDENNEPSDFTDNFKFVRKSRGFRI